MLYKRFLFAVLMLLLVVPIVAQAQGTCSSDGTLEEFSMTVVNDSNTAINVHWLQTDCTEAAATPVGPGESFSMTTYDGHEFVFRDPNGDSLMRYMVNTLLADGQMSILRSINEGAAAGAMWSTINPARAELGLEPIYFSGVLYNVAKEAAVMSGGDYSAFGTAIADMGLNSAIGWAGNAEGPVGGELLSTSEVADLITRSAQESIDSGDTFGWLNPDVQSFAVYADENQFGYIFSSMSQPELTVSNPEIMGGATPMAAMTAGSGYLSGGVDMDHYTFEGDEGVMYGISLTSSDFDTYLRVYDADGNEIATNDDGGEGLNSLLAFTLPATGVYTIGVDSFVPDASGYYRLSLTHTDIVILNFLTAESSDNALDVVAGTTYFVSVNSENFDTVMAVLDEAGNEVVSDDDGGEGFNSLATFTAASSGSYTIRVSSFAGAPETGLEYNVLIGTFPN